MRRVTCAHQHWQQWQHGNSTRRSSKTFKTWNYRSFLRTHSLNNEYLYNTYIFGHYSMLTAVYCVHRTCVNAPCRGTHRIFRIQCGKNSRQHFCFKLVNLYLLYEMRNRVWRDCKQLSLKKSMFSLKTFKASRCSNVRHNSVMSVQPSNVAITPPPEGI